MAIFSCRCQSPPPLLEATPIAKLSLPLLPTQNWWCFWPTYEKTRAGAELIWMYDYVARALIIYDYRKPGEITQVPVLLHGNQRDQAMSIHWHNEDSIFVMLNAAYHPQYWHDSTLFLMDIKGEVKQVYDVSSLPVWTAKRPNTHPDSVYFTFGFGIGISYHQGKVLLPLARYNAEIGDSLFNNPPTKIGGLLDISLESPTYEYLALTIPSTDGKAVPGHTKYPQGVRNSDSTVLVGFSFQGKIWEENLVSHQLTAFPSSSALYDATATIPVPQSALISESPYFFLDDNLGSYYFMEYDPIREQYLRHVQYPLKGEAAHARMVSSRMGVLLYDKQLKCKGEALLPEGHVGVCIFLPEGVAFWHKEKTDIGSDSLSFTLLDFGTPRYDLDIYSQEAIFQAPWKKPGGWGAYFSENHGFSSEKYAVLFAPAGLGCEGCLDYMIDFFLQQSIDTASAYGSSLRCIIAGENTQSIQKKLSSHKLDLTFPNLYVDENGAFKEYVSADFKQGQLILMDRGEAAGIVHIIPRQLPAIPQVIADFLADE
ncbi:MAG: hypothetical protein AAFP92_30880 [Bacteroidota bacterium]